MMTVIDIKLQRPVIPAELKNILSVIGNKVSSGGADGVVVSGRLPLWLAGALVHFFHPRPWVAIFDPRLLGGVVVMSHDPNVEVGKVVHVPLTNDGEIEGAIVVTYP